MITALISALIRIYFETFELVVAKVSKLRKMLALVDSEKLSEAFVLVVD